MFQGANVLAREQSCFSTKARVDLHPLVQIAATRLADRLRSRVWSVGMMTLRKLCVLLVGIALTSRFLNVAAQAPAPAPGIQLESDEAAAAAYPISTQQREPLTDSSSLPVTCNITLIGQSDSLTPAVAAAGRRLHAATIARQGLSTADIHCTGSYNVNIVGGPALQPFAYRWTGGFHLGNAFTVRHRLYDFGFMTSWLVECSRRTLRKMRCAM